MGNSYSLTLARLSAMAAREVELVLAPEGLRIEDWRVLDHLAETGPDTMSTLAEATAITGPTLTRTVDKLVSLAMVYRAASATDRRKVVVNLSARGLAAHSRMLPLVAEAETKALQSDPASQQLRNLASQLLAR